MSSDPDDHQDFDLEYKMFKFMYKESLLKESIYSYVWEQFLKTPPLPNTDLTPLELKMKFHFDMLKNLQQYRKLNWFQMRYFSQPQHFPGPNILENNDVEMNLLLEDTMRYDPDEMEEVDIEKVRNVLKSKVAYAPLCMNVVHPQKLTAAPSFNNNKSVTIAFSLALNPGQKLKLMSKSEIKKNITEIHEKGLTLQEIAKDKSFDVKSLEKSLESINKIFSDSNPHDTATSLVTDSVCVKDFSYSKRTLKHSTPVRRSTRLLSQTSSKKTR